MARQAGIVEIFHARCDDDPQTGFVLCHVPSKEFMNQFFAEAGESSRKVGHILESTELTMLNN